MFTEWETISDIQAGLEQIYSDVNEELETDTVLLRLAENVGYLARSIRLDASETDYWLTKSLTWLVALCNKIEIDVQTAILARYPKMCPDCVEKRCLCDIVMKIPKTRSKLSKRYEELSLQYTNLQTEIKNELFHPDLDTILYMLESIYPSNSGKWNINKYYFPSKLMEQNGRLIEGYRKYKIAGPRNKNMHLRLLSNDVGSYLAWLLAIWSEVLRKQGNVRAQFFVVERFRSGCPYCHSISCTCPKERRLGIRSRFGISPQRNYVDDPVVDVLEELRAIADTMKKIPGLSKEASNIAKIDKEAFNRKNLMSKLHPVVEKIRSGTDLGSNITNLGTRILNMIEAIEKLGL